MDVRRLRILLELSRWGSMREVADELGITTSTVSRVMSCRKYWNRSLIDFRACW